MFRVEMLKRVAVALAALAVVVGGGLVGPSIADKFLGPIACGDTSLLQATGVVGVFSGVLTLVGIALRDGFGGLVSLLRYVSGSPVDWAKEGLVGLFIGVLALSGLSALGAFVAEAVVIDESCPQSTCATQFNEVCGKLEAGPACHACNTRNAHRLLDEKLDRLLRQRIAGSALLFPNARAERTEDDERLDPEVGVKLADGQFRRWREGLFPDGGWPDDLRDDVAYCVVGTSSPAPFRGFKHTNRLNLEAANRRGQSAAGALARYLSSQGVDQVVAACGWCEFETMSRPEAVNGEHLTDEDRWLFNRAAFVYPISLDKNEHDLGCTEYVAERVCDDGSTPQCAKCLQCSTREWT